MVSSCFWNLLQSKANFPAWLRKAQWWCWGTAAKISCVVGACWLLCSLVPPVAGIQIHKWVSVEPELTWNPRMAWVEKDHSAHPVPTPCYVQGRQPAAQAAQSHIQPGLECLQGWGIHSLLGHTVQHFGPNVTFILMQGKFLCIFLITTENIVTFLQTAFIFLHNLLGC